MAAVISIHDALVNILAECDGVDATNAARKLRAAEDRVLTALFQNTLWKKRTPVAKRLEYLHLPMDEASTDGLIILASKNGMEDIFAL